MHRFYCPSTDFSPQKIVITNSGEIHHLKNVLRMSVGDEVDLFNGIGEEVRARIISISSSAIEVVVKSRKKDPASAGPRIILACAIPKKAKFEFIVEKCTELGVDEIVPLRTARTEVILKEDRQEKKNTRYQAVAMNAAKQSKRSVVPVIHPQRTFKEVIACKFDASLKLIPCLLGERKQLRDIVLQGGPLHQVVILIGPEGDFTEHEVKDALEAGYLPVTLGETTPKVDTAAIAAVAGVRLLTVAG